MSTLGKKIVRRLGEFAKALENNEKISKRFTCRKIKLKLEPKPYSPELVKRTRAVLRVSQPIFARFLGASTRAVQDWEQGVNRPNPAACRLMDEIRHKPRYWRKRLMELSEPVKAT